MTSSSTGNADVKSRGDSAKQLDFEKDSSDKATADVRKQTQEFESKQNDDTTDKREKTGETVNEDGERVDEEPVEEELVEEEPKVGVVGSAPDVVRLMWDSVPKLAAAIGIANDYRNGGVTKDIIDRGTEALRNIGKKIGGMGKN